MSVATFAVHVVAGSNGVKLATGPAGERGARFLRLDISSLRTDDDLERVMINLFEIPYPSAGFQSLIDFGSSLDEWMHSPAGYVLVVRGCDAAAPGVARRLADILPFMIDRWRSIGTPYTAVLECAESRPAVLAMLQEANRELRVFGESSARVARSGPVPVYVDGQLDEAVSVGAP